MRVSRISPQAFIVLNQQQDLTIVDVRTSIETAYEYMPNSVFLPLQELTPATFQQSLIGFKEQPTDVYLLCQRGIRADSAVKKLIESQCEHIQLVVIEGGLNALKAEGLQVDTGTSHIISLDRQARIASGVLILFSVFLGGIVDTSFYALCGFVGINLLVSGIWNVCGLNILLSKMPWNHIK